MVEPKDTALLKINTTFFFRSFLTGSRRKKLWTNSLPGCHWIVSKMCQASCFLILIHTQIPWSHHLDFYFLLTVFLVIRPCTSTGFTLSQISRMSLKIKHIMFTALEVPDSLAKWEEPRRLKKFGLIMINHQELLPKRLKISEEWLCYFRHRIGFWVSKYF